MLEEQQKILIVDDDEITRILMAEILADLDDVTVLSAESGAEALHLAAQHRPDLVLLDIYMPGMDGIEVCRRLLAEPATQDTAVMFITAASTPEDEERGLAAGALDFIRKPISPGIVQARARNILKLRRATQQLEQLASTDALTGARNRRYFLEAAEAEFRRSRRYDQSLSFLMLDIDHFKSVNDQWGHAIGDEALKAATAAIQGAMRREDTLGRLGGEEFAVLLPQTDAANAALFAERVRQAIAALEIDTGETPLRFTVSIGVAQVAPSDKTPKQALGRADAALYTAKNDGRNRVAAA